MKKEKFDVTGMTCSACSARVEKTVAGMEGTCDVSVNLLKNSMVVSYDENAVSEADIIGAVVKAGYGASVAGSAKSGTSTILSIIAVRPVLMIWDQFRLLKYSPGTFIRNIPSHIPEILCSS